jgi:hypothetical protein
MRVGVERTAHSGAQCFVGGHWYWQLALITLAVASGVGSGHAADSQCDEEGRWLPWGAWLAFFSASASTLLPISPITPSSQRHQPTGLLVVCAYRKATA